MMQWKDLVVAKVQVKELFSRRGVRGAVIFYNSEQTCDNMPLNLEKQTIS
jgi:hypothetical protein